MIRDVFDVNATKILEYQISIDQIFVVIDIVI